MPKPKKGVARDGLKFLGNERGLLKYEARVTLQHEGRRRDKQRTIFANSLREAEDQRDALLEELRAELAKKGQPKEAPPVLAEVVTEQWLKTLRHSTRVTYTSYARHFEKAFGDRALGSLTTKELQRFLDRLPLSDHSVNCMRGSYCTFFKWAKREGHITEDAMRATDKRTKVLTDAELLESVQAVPKSRAMTRDELVVFLRTFEQVDAEACLIFTTQFYLGCRIGEAIALHWADLDEATGAVVIRHNFSKGQLSAPKGKRARLTALPRAWVDKLQAHRARLRVEGRPMADVLVFPAPETHLERRQVDHSFWHYRSLRQSFCAVLESCGITLAERTATHAMRHTLVSLVRAQSQEVVAAHLVGVSTSTDGDEELRRRVGHSTAALTEHYTSVPHGKLLDFAEEVAQLLDNPKARRRTGEEH